MATRSAFCLSCAPLTQTEPILTKSFWGCISPNLKLLTVKQHIHALCTCMHVKQLYIRPQVEKINRLLELLTSASSLCPSLV